jgi:hypothetical protein
MHVQLSTWLNFHTSRQLVTFRPNFIMHDRLTNCHTGGCANCCKWQLVPPPKSGQKFMDYLKDTVTEKMWVERFKSTIVTRMKCEYELSQGLNVVDKRSRHLPEKVFSQLRLLLPQLLTEDPPFSWATPRWQCPSRIWQRFWIYQVTSGRVK